MREQIITQISLGIVSGDLQAGEKLPSTRELARRFQIHQNTISNAYRELAERGSVVFKKGSGVYVRGNEIKNTLESLISRFFHEAETHGYTTGEIKSALQKRLNADLPKHFLVVESNAELRKILIAEISDATNCRVEGVSFEDLPNFNLTAESPVLLVFEKSKDLPPQILPPDTDRINLKANSVPDSMTGKTRPSDDDLIAVVSGWESFLTLARMFLLAAKIAPETLIIRSTNEMNWQNGLQKVSLIICDSATAKQFSNDERVRIFQLIADSSLKDLLRSESALQQVSAGEARRQTN